ncbi:Hexosyltransferase [Sergentomyia squamirostris]
MRSRDGQKERFKRGLCGETVAATLLDIIAYFLTHLLEEDGVYVIGANILRDNSKWRVSPEEYNGDYYPPYCMGYVVLFSGDAVVHLYREVQNTPFFWIDDVHITGTLTQKTGIPLTGLNSMVLSKSQVRDILQGRMPPLYYLFFFTRPEISQQEIPKLWKKVIS